MCSYIYFIYLDADVCFHRLVLIYHNYNTCSVIRLHYILVNGIYKVQTSYALKLAEIKDSEKMLVITAKIYHVQTIGWLCKPIT
jgi:hypothetical protein